MHINQKLLYSSGVDDPDLEGLRNDLVMGRLSDKYHVIVYSASHTLEIYSYRTIHYNPGALRAEDCIVGLAVSREEAYELILEVMDQIYALAKYRDLPHFMEEVLGVKPCS